MMLPTPAGPANKDVDGESDSRTPAASRQPLPAALCTLQGTGTEESADKLGCVRRSVERELEPKTDAAATVAAVRAADPGMVVRMDPNMVGAEKQEAEAAEKNVVNADMLEAVRNDPKMLALLEPFMTQEMIDSIMKDA